MVFWHFINETVKEELVGRFIEDGNKPAVTQRPSVVFCNSKDEYLSVPLLSATHSTGSSSEKLSWAHNLSYLKCLFCCGSNDLHLCLWFAFMSALMLVVVFVPSVWKTELFLFLSSFVPFCVFVHSPRCNILSCPAWRLSGFPQTSDHSFVMVRWPEIGFAWSWWADVCKGNVNKGEVLIHRCQFTNNKADRVN